MNSKMDSKTRDDTDLVDLVDDTSCRELAEAYGLPLIELDAALHGETLDRAHRVLGWIDREERLLTARYGILEGRRRYRPVNMLKNYAKKHGTGRRRT